MSLCPSCPCGADLSITATITVTDPVAKTCTVESVDSSGSADLTVAAGKSSMSFFNYGPSVATINGTGLAVGAAIAYPFLGDNKRYGAIVYNPNGSDVRVDTTVIP